MMIISVTTAMSQQMPITVTPILTPPYTTSLSKMSESGSTSLMVNIYVGDVTITEVPVRLRIKMESHGITITSRKDAPVTPLFLGGGEARVLIGDDLKQTLQLDNLTFQGYDKTAYIKSGVLPGGLWKITVWLEHLHTGRTLSNKGIATAWMASYPPPVLTAPKQDAIAPTDILLPLTFTWQASKSVGGTASLLYTFEMWEMRTPGVPAQTIAAYTPPIITAQTSGLFHTVIPSAYAMEPGMRYCWRVTVSDPSGRASIQEGGHSEVREFQYLEKCPEVCDISITQKDVIATATWELNTLHKGGWNVEMYDDGGLYHETLWSGENHNGKKSYPHGTTWHIRVQGICQNGVTSEWSQWEDFTIPEAFTKPKRPDGTTYECGPRPEPRKITNFTEKELFPGDTIENERGTSKFEIYSATKNSNGSYRGLMYMHLNIWGVKVMCEYDNLRVNTDGVTISNFYMVSVEYDDLNMDVDAMKAWHEQLALDIAGTTYNNSIRDTINLGTYKVNFATLVKQKGKYYAVTELGDTTDVTYSLERKRRVMVEDAKGNKLMLDRDGNIMGVEEYRASGGNERLLKTFNAKKDSLMSTTDNITFEKVETENYGFDKWRGEEYDRDQYPTITDNNDYRPAYIGAEKEKTIRIKVNKTKGITFKSERGVPLIANEKDNTIAFNCGTTGRQAIYAYRDSTVVGKVNVQAYSYKDVKVHLVRVNGATKRLDVEAITKGVNEIFDDAVVRYTFDELDPITINYANKEHFVHGGKGTFQNYNEDQKTAIKALPETADQNDYYLFFVECSDRLDTAGNKSKDPVCGYMPVGRHYGFIYNEYTNARNIAHELAHGTNALHHTFSPESETFYTTSKTDNLMDYNAGEYLNHRQWQWAHEKHRNVLGFLDDEGESEAVQILVVYGANVALNASIQMLFAYMFDDNVNSWEDAWAEVNMYQALTEGAIDLIPIKKVRYALSFTNNFVQCLSAKEHITAESFVECGLLGLVDIVAGEAIEKYGLPAIKKGLAKIGLSPDKIDDVIKSSTAEDLPKNSIADVDANSIKKNTANIANKVIITFKKGEALSLHNGKYAITVVNVRNGTNGKYAIIGRSMQPIETVAKDLEDLVGKGNVVILDDRYLNGMTFRLEEYSIVLSNGTKVTQPARNWSQSEAWSDMRMNDVYKKVKTDGFITNKNDLKNTPMYRVNKQWIEKMKSDGYTIIDIGNPLSNSVESMFYNMEKGVMGW